MTPSATSPKPTHKIVYLLNWWMGSFDASLEGVEPITREGTPVPTSLIPKARRRAARFGISLSTKPRSKN